MAIVSITTRLTGATETTTGLRGVSDELGRVGSTTDKAAGSTEKLDRGFTGINRTASLLRTTFVALGVSLGVSQIVQAADTYTLLNSRLQLVTDSTAELTSVQGQLFAIAQETRSSFEATVTVFTRVARAGDELGRTNQEIVRVTETLNKAIAISGATAQESAAGLIQLSQGLASGALRGDELRSVLEQLPGVARAIARGLGVTIGQLRELGAEGELSAQKVVDALLSQADAVDREFARIPTTISGAVTQVSNSLVILIGRLDQATGASELLARALNLVATDFERLSNLFAAAPIEVKIVTETRKLIEMEDAFEGLRASAERAAAAARAAGAPEAAQEFLDQIDDQNSAIERQRFLVDKLIRQQRELADQQGDAGAAFQELSDKEVEAAIKRGEANDAFAEGAAATQEALDQQAVEGFDKRLKAAEELAEEEQRLRDEASEKLVDQLQEEEQLRAELADQAREQAEEQSAFRQEGIDDLERELATVARLGEVTGAQREIEAQLAAETEEARRRGIDLTEEEIEQRRELIGAIVETEDAIRSADEAMEEAALQAAAFGEEIAEIFENAADRIRRTFDDVFFDIIRNGKLDFEEFGESILDIFARVGAELTTSFLFEIGASLLTGGATGGLGGGLLGSIPIVGDLIEGVTDFFGGLFQHGGVLPRGKFGIVGEAGPEFFSANDDGGFRITPISQRMMSSLQRAGVPGFVVGGVGGGAFGGADPPSPGGGGTQVSDVSREDILRSVLGPPPTARQLLDELNESRAKAGLGPASITTPGAAGRLGTTAAGGIGGFGGYDSTPGILRIQTQSGGASIPVAGANRVLPQGYAYGPNGRIMTTQEAYQAFLMGDAPNPFTTPPDVAFQITTSGSGATSGFGAVQQVAAQTAAAAQQAAEEAERRRKEIEEFDAQIALDILRITDPLQVTFNALDKQRQVDVQTARNLGADVGQAQELNRLRRGEFVTGELAPFRAQAASLRGAAVGLSIGSLSPLSPREQFRLAQREFRRVAALPAGEEGVDVQGLLGAGGAFLQEAREFGGSGPAAAQAFAEVQASLQRAAASIETQVVAFGSRFPGRHGVSGDPGFEAVVAELREVRAELRMLNTNTRIAA